MNQSMELDLDMDLVHLPEPIKQHILTFFSTKEAAQTTILSKSWRRAWSTQPNLVFQREDMRALVWDSRRETPLCPALELARKTIQRYEESNLYIQSLTIFVIGVAEGDSVLWNEVIEKSMILGATHLNLNLRYDFVLPSDIVFGSRNLVGLTVGNCEIEIGSSVIIRCSGLESLSLADTVISVDSLSKIISRCPSIQKLTLSGVKVEEEGVNGVKEEEEGVNRPVGLGLMKLLCLTSLELVDVDFDTLFLGEMSSRFPLLKDFTLLTRSTTTSTDNEIRISSRSLECLNFALEKGHLFAKRQIKFKFDLPSIRRFTYKGRVIPLLSFDKSISGTWESHVAIEHYKEFNSVWFLKLNKFLRKLKRSKISQLSLEVKCSKGLDYELGVIRDLRGRVKVENLNVDVGGLPTGSCYAFFDGLFQIVRPKLITQYLHPADKVRSEYFLCKEFRPWQEGIERHLLFCGLRDLEEVNAELFDKEMVVWRHVPLNLLLDDASMTDEQIIRFQLKWKRKPHGADL